LSFYDRRPGVYFYRSREVVPHSYWSRWHGDRRYYWEGHPHDRDRDGIPNRLDRHPRNPYRN
jgi:hypothetical protein